MTGPRDHKSKKLFFFLIAFQEQFIDYQTFAPPNPWLGYRVQPLLLQDVDELMIDELID